MILGASASIAQPKEKNKKSKDLALVHEREQFRGLDAWVVQKLKITSFIF